MAKKTDIKARLYLDNKDLKSGLDESEGMLSGFGGAATRGLQAAGVAAAVGFAKGMLDGLGQQQLAAKFGEEIAVSSAAVYRNAWGESIEDVATQMRDVQAGLGDAGNIEAMTEAAFILGEKFDRDVGGTIQDVTELVESFGLEGEAAFDLWASALEGSTSEVQDELSAATREYGDFFADMGLSAEETLGLLKDFGEGGAMELDKMADATKELLIRGTDMSTGSVDAYDAMGLSAEGMAEMFLAGGDDAKAAMEITAASLLAIEDPVEQATAAIALFGSPLEDLGVSQIPSFLDSLSNMGSGLEATEGAVAAMGDAMSDNLGTKLEGLKRGALGALADLMQERVIPAVENMVASVEENWPRVRDAIMPVIDSIKEKFDEYWPIIQEVVQTVTETIAGLVAEHWPQIQEIITGVMETIEALIDRVTKIVLDIWERWGEDITEFAEKYWTYVQDQIEAALDLIQSVFSAFKALFEGDWEALWSALGDAMDAALELIKNAIGLAWDAIKLGATIAWDLIKNEVLDAVKAIPGLLLDLGELLWSTGKTLFMFAARGIAQALADAATAIIDWVLGLPGSILDLGVDLWQVGWDIFTSLANGLGEALAGIPGMIADLVLGPLDAIKDKAVGLLNIIPGVDIGGGDPSADETAAAAAVESSLLAAVKSVRQGIATGGGGGGGGSVGFSHSGGMITQPMADVQNFGFGSDEVVRVLKVGENVQTPQQQAQRSGGINIETLIVPDSRSLQDELSLQLALRGAA